MGSMFGPNRAMTKDVKSCTYCCYFRCATLILWEGGMPWPETVPCSISNSVPCTVSTSRQMTFNQSVGCLQWLGSRSFRPVKRSGPRLLSTVPWGMNHICCLMFYFVAKGRGQCLKTRLFQLFENVQHVRKYRNTTSLFF